MKFGNSIGIKFGIYGLYNGSLISFLDFKGKNFLSNYILNFMILEFLYKLFGCDFHLIRNI
jgi:hypothetical protein